MDGEEPVMDVLKQVGRRRPGAGSRGREVFVVPDTVVEGDEISLIDIWRILVKRKWVIFLVTAMVTFGAVAYALLATPIYKAETIFLPPTKSDIQALKVQGVQDVTVASVYAQFKQNLSSRTSRFAVFKKMDLLEKLTLNKAPETNVEAAFAAFNKDISITVPKKQKDTLTTPSIRLSLEGSDPSLTAEIVNQIAKEAQLTTKKEFILDMEAQKDSQIKNLNIQIHLLRENARKKRLDEIQRLKSADTLEKDKINAKIASLRIKKKNERLAKIATLEDANHTKIKAIEDEIKRLRHFEKVKRIDTITKLEEADSIAHDKIINTINTINVSAEDKQKDRMEKLRQAYEIAKSLGISEPITYKLHKIDSADTEGSQIITNISDKSTQLYTRGYEALHAEMISLGNQKPNEPFLPEIRKLQDRLTQLSVNEQVVALKSRKNDDPFISNLRGLQSKIKALKNDEIIIALKTRKNDDPFIPELRNLQEKLVLLQHLDSSHKCKA